MKREHLVLEISGQPGVLLHSVRSWEAPVETAQVALLPGRLRDYGGTVMLEWWTVEGNRATVLPSGAHTKEITLPVVVLESSVPKPKGRGWRWVRGEWIK